MPGSMNAAQLPPHLVQYGGYGLPPVAQMMSPYPNPPGYPYPYGGQPPMTFTKQMQAVIELDDIPQRYKLQEARTRRIVWAAVVALLFVGGIGLAVLLTRQEDSAARSALVIKSDPAGATVTVDGVVLADPTPVRFETDANARHELEVALAGYQTWKNTQLAPASGDREVSVTLSRPKVKIRVNTTPSGAEIFVGDVKMGTSPKNLEGLDPDQVRRIKLVHPDFDPVELPIDWAKEPDGIADIDHTFPRK
jgi:hypothetical protein